MPYLDRDGLIELLEKLGCEDDAEVLAAAREIRHRIDTAEIGWHELLVPAPGSNAIDAMEEEYPGADGGGFEIRAPRREPEPSLPGLPPVPERLAVIYSEELNLIDSLLRRELMDLRTDLADDDFAEMDRAYLRDLAARLNARDRED